MEKANLEKDQRLPYISGEEQMSRLSAEDFSVSQFSHSVASDSFWGHENAPHETIMLASCYYMFV